MVSWQSIQTLVVLAGPWLLPRALAAYRSLRSRPASRIKPLSTRTSYALTLLFAMAAIALLSTLPLFGPANLFRLTQARLDTTGGVIRARLAALRPLTPTDEQLTQLLDQGGLEARLLYARYGPQILLDCPLARPGDLGAARKYFFYALPSLAAPHLLHLFALGTVTSSLLSGKEGSQWRSIAIMTGLVLALADIYFVAAYDDAPNARNTAQRRGVNTVDFVFWKLRVWRGLGIACTDALLGWVIWLQATGRAFVRPAPVGERVADHAQRLDAVLGKLRTLGILRNSTMRDVAMRRTVEGYWVKEGELTKSTLEEPEVLQAQRSALQRLDMTRIGRDAETFAASVLAGAP